jgi:hypothetical protein
MKLITEVVEDVKYLVEESDGVKNLFIHGPFLQADVVNRNKRVYPLNVLENEVGRYIKENVSTNRAYGELNHPDKPIVNLDRVAILIKELKQDGPTFVGKAKVVDTPMGNIVKNLIAEGANLGVSSRALGSLKARKDGINEVQNDLRLAAVDVVSDPSGPSCFINGIMENAEWIWNDREWIMQEAKKEINTSIRKREFNEQVAMRVFEKVLNEISKS